MQDAWHHIQEFVKLPVHRWILRRVSWSFYDLFKPIRDTNIAEYEWNMTEHNRPFHISLTEIQYRERYWKVHYQCNCSNKNRHSFFIPGRNGPMAFDIMETADICNPFYWYNSNYLHFEPVLKYKNYCHIDNDGKHVRTYHLLPLTDKGFAFWEVVEMTDISWQISSFIWSRELVDANYFYRSDNELGLASDITMHRKGNFLILASNELFWFFHLNERRQYTCYNIHTEFKDSKWTTFRLDKRHKRFVVSNSDTGLVVHFPYPTPLHHPRTTHHHCDISELTTHHLYT